MSSIEYATIYDHAAAVVKSECGSTPEVTKVLDDFRSRALSDEKDPLANRQLMVEPMHDAQILEVPFELVEKVAAQLHRLNILHIWVRATCPSEDDSAEVVETDNPKTFREMLGSPCPHCGQLHEDIGWENMEIFYAFHYDNVPDKFRFSTYFRKPQELPGAVSEHPSRLSRIGRWFREGPLSRFFPRRAQSPAETVLVALETNAPNTAVPSQKETLTVVWGRGSALAFSGLVVSYLISLYSVTWAIIAGAVFLLCFLTLAWISWKAIWAAASMERRVLTCGYLLAFALLTGASGFGMAGNIHNEPSEQEQKQNLSTGEPKWDFEWQFGETNPHLVWAAVVTFLGTSITVFGLNWNRVTRQ